MTHPATDTYHLLVEAIEPEYLETIAALGLDDEGTAVVWDCIEEQFLKEREKWD